MADFSINRLNSLQGLSQLAGSQARKNVDKAPNVFNTGGTDSVQFSSRALIGTGSTNVADIVGNVSKLSLEEAKAQLNPSTAFGLGLF